MLPDPTGRKGWGYGWGYRLPMTRPSFRNALLGLIDQIPLIGSGAARSIEDHWPSRREREQAAVIAAQVARIRDLETEIIDQRGQIGELKHRVATFDSPGRVVKNAKDLARMRRYGRIGDE